MRFGICILVAATVVAFPATCSALVAKNPVRVRVTRSAEHPVPADVDDPAAAGGTVEQQDVEGVTPPPALRRRRLTDYMRLPAAQYSCVEMPLKSSLDRLPGSPDSFVLRVPPVGFSVPLLPKVEVTPEVYARVSTEADRVVITSERCVMSGSPFVERLGLNDRIDFRVETCFTWQDAERCPVDATDADDGRGTPEHGGGGDGGGGRVLFSHTKIKVDVDPPPPFSRVPRRVLEAMGNSAMGIALGRLQGEFLRNLAGDYEMWATDAAYRAARRRMEEEMEAEMEAELAAGCEQIIEGEARQ